MTWKTIKVAIATKNPQQTKNKYFESGRGPIATSQQRSQSVLQHV